GAASAAPANPRPRPIPKPPQPQPRRPPQPPPHLPRQCTSVAVAGTAAFRETVLVGTEAARDRLGTEVANAPASATAMAVFRWLIVLTFPARARLRGVSELRGRPQSRPPKTDKVS